jgi:hypothetical protein
MFCPNCASPVAEDQKFCRSCGLPLDAVAKLVTGSSVGEHREMAEGKKGMVRSVRWGVVTLMIGLLIGCIIPILAGLQNYTTAPLAPLFPILAGFAGLFLFGGVIIMLFFQTDGSSANKTRRKVLTATPSIEDTNELPPGSDSTPIPSVTERTTGLLERVESGVKTPEA